MKILCTLLCSYVFAQNSLIIIRHGQADHNVREVFNSTPNHPQYFPAHLTDTGRRQVLNSAKKLMAQGFTLDNIKHVYVSPLPRTQETASILAKQGVFKEGNAKIDERVIEASAGDLEGHCFTSLDLARTFQEMNQHGGEGPEELRVRMNIFYQELLKEKHHGNILVVTHGSPAYYLAEIAAGTAPQDFPTAGFVIIPLP